MPLTQFDLKNAKPAEAAYKLSDGGGLYLLVKPNGARLWRMKYRIFGKEQLLSFGAYPLFSLAEARAKRDEAKKLIASGSIPASKRKPTDWTQSAPPQTPSDSSPQNFCRTSKPITQRDRP